ncbi:MAG: hypothetical protein JXR91_08100 [Deltaproteobacteria bacterium]|nr:hypothetical protein [Deltaproteobacteria bacterium]
MSYSRFFFLGIELNSDLRTHLDNCAPSNKLFIENPEYLEQISIEDSQYIGRRLNEFVSISEIEDCSKNVRSLLLRIAPGFKISTDNIIIKSVQEEISNVPVEQEY